MNKSFWMAKGADGDPAFEGPSKIEPKRSHQWLVDDAEPALFSNKKQALFTPNSTTGSVMQDAPSWDSTPSFQSVPNPFIHRLLGSETVTSISFSERDLSADGADNSVSLSIARAVEDAEACPSYGSLRRVKVNQVKDSDHGIYALKENDFTAESNSEISTSEAFNGGNESSFISIGQAYDKRDGNITLMGHSYDRGDTHIGSGSPSYIQADENGISISDSYSKEEVNMISFGGFPDDAHDIVPVGRSISSYDQSYNQPSDQPLEEVHGKELDASNANAAVGKSRTIKLKPASVSKNKPEFKATKKEAPNSFPSNVRSLISTGMLDGVPVKYVSVSREVLQGVIKGSGYLCGCQLCNYSKVINAYEFERHAGCKTKHPNNHIFFENGKTIYQIVQELRSTPESLLFDVIQTVFGAPINQKAFRSWKESFQAATRELQRIYGKEQLNL